MLTTTHGDAPYKPDHQMQCWGVVMKFLRIFFTEMRRHRIVADSAYSIPSRSNLLHLWGTLQGHRVMQDFQAANFREHKLFYPQIVMHLFETYVPKTEMDKAVSSNTDLKRQCSALDTQVSTLKRNHDQLVSTVNDLKRQCAKK